MKCADRGYRGRRPRGGLTPEQVIGVAIITIAAMLALTIHATSEWTGMNGEDIVNTRVRTVLKAKVSEITTDYSMMDLYSGNRNAINSKLTDFLNQELHEQFGIEVIDASIIDVHPDAQLQQTIAESITENLLKKMEMEARQEHGWVEVQGSSVVTTTGK